MKRPETFHVLKIKQRNIVMTKQIWPLADVVLQYELYLKYDNTRNDFAQLSFGMIHKIG